jgi:membrane associated rhomboid family serine protease
MLLVPSEKPFDYRQPPRLSLGLAALLLILFAWLSPQQNSQIENLSIQYQQQLLELEWPLYPTHILQHQQIDTLNKLQFAYEHKDNSLLMQQIGFDRAFVQNIQNTGSNYFEPEQLSQWQTARQAFDSQRDQLISQILGLDSQRFRPITYFTYAFFETSLYSVLAAALLLLLVGMVVEWSMGSGALLSAWLVGSMVTGITFNLSHLYSVTPLLDNTGAMAGVLGIAFMHFRKSHSLTITGTKTQLSGWLFLALFALIAGIDFAIDTSFDIGLLVAHGLSFVSGMIVCVMYNRWFVSQASEDNLADIVIDEEPLNNVLYQEELDDVLQKIANFNFNLAEQNLRELEQKYPQDKRIQETLYHLCKFRPSELEFEELACSLFNLPNQASAHHISLRIYNDYKKRSHSFVALDTDTCLQLAMRFARINAFKEAEEIFKRALDDKRPSLLLKKAALNLQQAFLAQHQEQRAKFYQQIANRPDEQTT